MEIAENRVADPVKYSGKQGNRGSSRDTVLNTIVFQWK